MQVDKQEVNSVEQQGTTAPTYLSNLGISKEAVGKIDAKKAKQEKEEKEKKEKEKCAISRCRNELFVLENDREVRRKKALSCYDYFCKSVHFLPRPLPCADGLNCKLKFSNCNLLHPQVPKGFCIHDEKESGCFNYKCDRVHKKPRNLCPKGAFCLDFVIQKNNQANLTSQTIRCDKLHPLVMKGVCQFYPCTNVNCVDFIHEEGQQAQHCANGVDCPHQYDEDETTKCQLAHPKFTRCKYGWSCRRDFCRFIHPEKEKEWAEAEKGSDHESDTESKHQEVNDAGYCLYNYDCVRYRCPFKHSDDAPQDCSYGGDCKIRGCCSKHPIKCINGAQCKLRGCNFAHPKNPNGSAKYRYKKRGLAV